MNGLNKRLAALECGVAHLPHCWVVAEDDEDAGAAIERHKRTEGCLENSGGHVVWVVA